MNQIPAETVRVIILTTISFIVALIVTPLWFRVLKKYRFGKHLREEQDAPVFHQFHKDKEGVPTAAGVIIWGTVLILAVFFGVMGLLFDGRWRYFNFISRPETYLPLAALTFAAILGFIDDWFGVLRIGGASGGGLKIRQKSIVYIFLALIGAWWFYFRLGWDELNVPFFGDIHVGLWYIPIFIFIVFAAAFSANETDGLDGLLGGVSLFTFLALVAVSFALHRYDLAAFCGVMIGALLAFLWNNIYPAKFMMGDTGSMSLGITIGVVAMLTNTALLLPFFAVILVVESLSVIIQMTSKKLRHGKKVFRSAPIHHHFEALGWPESQVTMRFWIVSAVFAALGLVIFFVARVI
jgi:phospho-N-acetylmuramoyl-pentapeptide-transferase